MTTRRQVVTDEQLGKLDNQIVEFRERVRFGPLKHKDAMAGLQAMMENRSMVVPAVHPTGGDDPLSAYRKIKNLIFVGPGQWNRAITTRDRKNRNPLGLPEDWCPQVVPTYTVEQMKELARFCEIQSDWQTRVILYLVLPKVGEVPTSLIGQYQLWGVAHDGLGPGQIRSDVMYSNWFVKTKHKWASSPPVNEPVYAIGYEHPLWIAQKSWSDQQQEARDRGMTITSAVQDALMLSVVLAGNGKKLRLSTWSRTSTEFGCPLSVDSYADGVLVNRDWYPHSGVGTVAAAVQGVPGCFVS